MLEYVDAAIAFTGVMLILSLAVTALVQIAFSFANLRSRNLAWALERLITQLAPELRAHAREIARRVVNHSAITSGPGERAASVVHPEELALILHEIASSDAHVDLGEAQAALAGALKRVRSVGGEAMSLVRDVGKAGGEPKAAAPGAPPDALAGVRSELRIRFDAAMARASEHFTRTAHRASTAFAIGLAFAFQVDSLALVERLTADGELRAATVASTERYLQGAPAALARTKEQREPATTALRAVGAELAGDAALAPFAARLAEAPVGWAGYEQGRQFLEQTLADAPGADRERATALYTARYDAVLGEAFGEGWSQLGDLRAELRRSRLALVPRPYGWKTARVPGVVLTAVLLVLGAPFWFNVLRQLSGLRPALAETLDPKRAGPGARRKVD